MNFNFKLGSPNCFEGDILEKSLFWCNAMQCGAMHQNSLKMKIYQCGAMQCNAVHCSAMVRFSKIHQTPQMKCSVESARYGIGRSQNAQYISLD